LLEPVALIAYQDVYDAARTALVELKHIPARFHPSMIFKFDEWQMMTYTYYSHRGKKYAAEVKSYFDDEDEDDQLTIDQVFQELH